MDKEIILSRLRRVRDIRFCSWQLYREDSKKYPNSQWPRNLMNQTDMDIRVLDYVMEAIRKNDIV